MKRYLVFIFLISFFSVTAQNKKSDFYKPAPATFKPVNDFAGILTMEENQLLTAKLKQYRDSNSNVVVIITQQNLTEPLTNEEYSIEEVALHYFNKWQIGDKIKNNGVLIFIAKENRKVRIATGKGVEDKLTDENCQYVIDNDIVPNFKQQQYYTGLNEAVSTIMDMLSSKPVISTPAQHDAGIPLSNNSTDTTISANEDTGSTMSWFLIVCVLLVIFIIFQIRRTRSNRHQYIGSDTVYSNAYNPGCGSFIPFMGWGYGGNRNYINNSNSNYYGGSDSPSYTGNDSSSSFSSGDSSSGSSYGGGSSDGGGASGSW